MVRVVIKVCLEEVRYVSPLSATPVNARQWVTPLDSYARGELQLDECSGMHGVVLLPSSKSVA